MATIEYSRASGITRSPRLNIGFRDGKTRDFVSRIWTSYTSRNNGAVKMDEKRFYDEKEETKQIPMVCPHCRQEGTFPVRWMVRTKKAQPPRGGNGEDRAKFK